MLLTAPKKNGLTIRMQRVRPKLLTPALVAATLLALSCSPHSESHAAQAANHPSRRAAADFSLQDANGSAVKLSDFHGKVVLLNFWATWCGPCAVEIPWFIELQKQYASQGLEIIGVSMDEDGWKAVKPYVQEHKLNYPVLLGTESVGQSYGGVDSLPTTFLIDRQGKIAQTHVGLAGKNEYQNEIQALLGAGQQTADAGRVGVPALLALRPAK